MEKTFPHAQSYKALLLDFFLQKTFLFKTYMHIFVVFTTNHIKMKDLQLNLNKQLQPLV